MIALTAQDVGWKQTRMGKFTASTIGQLMTSPRSKADREAGGWSATAMKLIKVKAIERLTGQYIRGSEVEAMRRGLLLEPAALHLLNRHWRNVDVTTWQEFNSFIGATPDGLVDQGTATMDLKCPMNAADVLLFQDEVQDGSWESLLAWDKDYAWQIMTQSLCCELNTCWLVYFTDRLSIRKFQEDEREEVQSLIDQRAELHSQESLYPWSYTFDSDGYYFAAKRFERTDEITIQLLSTLARANEECDRQVERLKAMIQ
jgi:hypothetical protein